MVPKIHARGTSFKGAASYLLHDKGRARTAQRVTWAETRNLATGDPHLAWRVMAATAMDQARLKEQAGIRNTGRKSAESVLHFTLSWHEGEKADLTRTEMRRAALGALRSLGASDRQALLVCHNDEKHPHVHVLVNRVSPEDGRMLSSSKEKLNLSKWAENYEKERGRIHCTQRILNNAARARGEYVRGKKDQARHIYELSKTANDNDRQAAQLQEWQRRQAAEIARRQRAMEKRQKREWAALMQRHLERRQEIHRQAVRRAALAKDSVREGYREKWEAAVHKDQAELRRFEQLEARLSGRFQNALRAVDFGAIVRGRERRQAIREAFQVFANKGARLEALKATHQRRADGLLAQQRTAEHQAEAQARHSYREELDRNRAVFQAERSDLVRAQGMDQAALRAAWKTHRQQRDQAWEKLRRTAPRHDDPPPRRQAEEFKKRVTETEGEKRARQIEEFRQKMAQRQVERRRDRNLDRDR